jgi:hypothetical protein
MKLALDFDDTFTRDPALWVQFTLNSQQRGHIVYGITMRTPQECVGELFDNYRALVDYVIPTSRAAKKSFCEDVHGLIIDVWIDDRPFWILNDAL